jgi:predicted nucleic acid-binding protein
MTVLVDTSVIIDYLRGHHGAGEVLEGEIGCAVARERNYATRSARRNEDE